MAKDKSKGTRAPPHKHLLARTAFLQRAATSAASQHVFEGHLTAATSAVAPSDVPENNIAPSKVEGAPDPQPHFGGLPFILATQLRQVALRSQIRLSSADKRAICKVCSAVLINPQTSEQFVENLSRHGKKKHASVLVIECLACGNRKRIPTDAARQRRKSKRDNAQAREDTTSTNKSA